MVSTLSRSVHRGRLLPLAVSWAVAVSLWGPPAVLLSASTPTTDDRWQVWVVAALLGVGAAATVSAGFLLGRARMWRPMSGLVCAGTVITLLWYVAAELGSRQPDGDTIAAVGAVFLAPFVAATLAVLLGTGGLAGRIGRQRTAHVSQRLRLR